MRDDSVSTLSGPLFVAQGVTIPDHLLQYDIAPGGCWIARRRGPNGYAWNTTIARPERRKGSAYKLLWELLNGPVPEGKELHHTCHGGPNGCVNWHHMEPVTQRENMLASRSFVTLQAEQTHCKRGHLLDNPVRRKGKRANQRNCRECNKLYIQIKAMVPPPVYCSYCKGNLGPDQVRARRHYCDRCKAKFLQAALNLEDAG